MFFLRIEKFVSYHPF